MRSIISLFAKSPFGPLHEHMLHVKECVLLTRPLFDAFINGDIERVEELAQKISEAEHQADDIKNSIRNHLPKSFLLPVDKVDILNFLREQDAIADVAEDLGVLLTLRRIKVPNGLKDALREFIDKVIEVCEIAFEASAEIKRLAEASFSGKEADKIIEIVQRVERAEWESDKLQFALAKKMFSMENELDPVSIILLMHIFAAIGEMANHAENTAERMRMMLAK